MIHTLYIRVLMVFALLAGTFSALYAQDSPATPTAEKVPTGRIRPVKGYYYTVEDGEEVKMIVLADVTVYPPIKFKNKKQEEFYWKTVRDVKKTLPYAKLITSTILETYEYIETLPTKAERDAHLKNMEKDVYAQYKPILRQFTKGQAHTLIKLIKRETNQSSYDILKAFLGTFRAGFWQTFGRLLGVNLKTDYRPERDEKDAIIERVATQVELGLL